MHMKGAVFKLKNLNTLNTLNCTAHLILMRLAATVHDDVFVKGFSLDFKPSQTRDIAANIANSYGKSPQHAGLIHHADSDADRKCGSGGVGHNAP